MSSVPLAAASNSSHANSGAQSSSNTHSTSNPPGSPNAQQPNAMDDAQFDRFLKFVLIPLIWLLVLAPVAAWLFIVLYYAATWGLYFGSQAFELSKQLYHDVLNSTAGEL